MKFYKYESCGNDFIIIKKAFEKNDKMLAVSYCDRNYGIGADGLLVVDEENNINIYNQDGTTAEMCGNGLKCLIKYFYDKKQLPKKVLGYRFEIYDETLPVLIKINFKYPICKKYNLTMSFLNEEIIYHKVSEGVNHVILFKDFNLEEAKVLQKKEKSNINYVRIVKNNVIEVITYELGVGLTKSCCTGSIASYFVAYELGYLKENGKVIYEKDEIKIEILKSKISVIGTANYVFTGEI